jgi:hypothetical protein
VQATKAKKGKAFTKAAGTNMDEAKTPASRKNTCEADKHCEWINTQARAEASPKAAKYSTAAAQISRRGNRRRRIAHG